MDQNFLELRLEPLWESSGKSDEYTSSFSSSTGAILLGRGGCEPPEPKWKVDFALASRRHCWFQHSSSCDEIVVVDVSRGGTFINGNGASRSKGTKLTDGDILSLVTPVGSGSSQESSIRAWKVHIQRSQVITAAAGGEMATGAAPTAREEVAAAAPRVSFQIARPKAAAAAGYAARAEAQDFLQRIGRPVPSEPREECREAGEPEPEETPADLAEKNEPEEEAHSDEQVMETAQLLSRLQIGQAATVPESGPSMEPQAENQYAIIDTNQLLDHLDAVNGMLEHVVGVNIIVPIIVLHELDTISRRDDAKANAARYARSFLVRFMSSQRCSSGQEPSSISLQEMVESVSADTRGVRPNNDDQIVGCALYFATRVAPGRTEVFTEDRGLAVKLRARTVPTESVNACLSRGLANKT